MRVKVRTMSCKPSINSARTRLYADSYHALRFQRCASAVARISRCMTHKRVIRDMTASKQKCGFDCKKKYELSVFAIFLEN